MQENTQDALNNGAYVIGNFDANLVQSDEVILITVAMDISPSVASFEKDLNSAFKDFLEEMQGSHVADKLLVKVIEFNENVVDKTAFQPIGLLDLSSVTFKASGNSTALYDASQRALEETLKYRKQLEDTGVNCKCLVFVITDGEDNTSRHSPGAISAIIEDLNKEERNVFSFETILFGIGNSSSSFTYAQKEMGFKHLAIVGNSGKEVRKLIGFISASISKSASNQNVTF